MNTTLLACIRGATERVPRAEALERVHHPMRFRLLAPLRVFRELAYVPVRCPSEAVFYLSAHPRPNSKAGHVYRELIEAGIPARNIQTWPTSRPGNSVKLARLLYRLPWAMAALASLAVRMHRPGRLELQIILGREAYRSWLRKHPRLHPVVISDVSPSLHMLWSAAAAEGNRAIWWQDDFHHAFHLPYPIRGAAVLNVAGLNRVDNRGTADIVAARPTSLPRPLRAIPEKPVVGVTTNAAFAAGKSQLELLETLAKKLELDELQIRLHPNSRLTQADFSRVLVKVAPADESIAAFAERVDLVVVGNTAAQLWLIRNGVPVVHLAGLDEQGYDLYGYAQRGFVFGATDLDEISLARICHFYQSNGGEIYEAIKDHTTLSAQPDIRNLASFRRLIGTASGGDENFSKIREPGSTHSPDVDQGTGLR